MENPLGIDKLLSSLVLDVAATPASEYSKNFFQGMINRMGVSFHKYGYIRDGFPKKADAIESLKVRLARYEEDGNTEWLMDVANFAMIEYMHPAHPKAHFDPQDSDTSPGRVGHNGRTSRKDNHAPVWTAPGPKTNEKDPEGDHIQHRRSLGLGNRHGEPRSSTNP